MNRLLWVAWVSLILLVSACGGTSESTAVPTPSDTPTPNEIIVTRDPTRMSDVLPPSWTPTSTPTITPTPTPTATFTVTPSVTPLDADLLCQDFSFSTLIVDGETYNQEDSLEVSFGIGTDYDYAFIGVVMAHDIEDELVQVRPGGTSYTVRFDVLDFPASGRWDYRGGVSIQGEEDILCRVEGHFFIEEGAVRAEQPSTIPTALPVPSATPAVTQDNCDVLCPF